MRCRQAQSRIIEHEKSGTDPTKDRSLMDHLGDCPVCAEELDAADLLGRLLRRAGEDDTTDITPLVAARRTIEARAQTTAGRPSVLQRIGAALSGRVFRRPARLGYALVVVGLLLAVTLIPFRYHQTVGYAVAFAGVEKELVEDNETICDILYDLGLFEADVDVLGCDTTCNVRVIALRSLEEARMVVTAFNQVENCCSSSDIMPVRVDRSGSHLNCVPVHINNKIANHKHQFRI